MAGSILKVISGKVVNLGKGTFTDARNGLTGALNLK